MRSKVTVFGSSVVDLTARAPHLPAPGETVKGSMFLQGPGGKGFNQAVAAKKAGGDVTMIAKLGRDLLAQTPLAMMDEIGLSKEHLFFHDSLATGVSLITVDEKTSQNAIVIVPGACASVTREDLAKIEPQLRASAYVLLQLEVNQDANEALAQLCKDAGVRVVINTAPYLPVSDAFLRGAYLVTPNEVEAEALTGVAITDLPSANAAARVLLDRGVENVIITLGSRGVYVCAAGRAEILPALRVKAADTTGAGDAFNGALLTALSEGKDLWEAARFANAAAALSVQRFGAAQSMPSRSEIDALLTTIAR